MSTVLDRMTAEHKKSYLLLLSVVFHYHGLDDKEQKILNQEAASINATEELVWVNKFVSEDIYSAYDRARAYFKESLSENDREKKLVFLSKVWKANEAKGHITEMEATAMLRLAKDWKVERDLMNIIRKK